jgi:hypothetical protein
VKVGKSATETYNLLKKLHGDECLSCTQVFEWFKRFKQGREEIGDDQHPVVPAHQKQMPTLKKSVKFFDKIIA